MKIKATLLVAVLVLFTGCMNDTITQPNTFKGNFEALWKIIDTRYCYLDYKHVNWDSIHTAYVPKVDTVKSEMTFFNLMGNMLTELKDGHVNLYSYFDKSRYWKWFTDYPTNFSSSLITGSRYLGTDYKIAGPFHYGLIANGKVGYIYYESFEDGFADQNISAMMTYFSNCKGLIIDVRNNGGGSLDNSKQLASYFFKVETTTGYIRHKTGDGHSDFSAPVAVKTAASKNIQWQRPVIMLTNRKSYSATNEFVCRMKESPQGIIVGDKSGGGGGLPLSSELPNGWLVRFSSSPMYDAQMQNIEFGIDPDYPVALTAADQANGIDTIIEKAIALIK